MQADLAAHFAALDVTDAVTNDPEAAARAAEEERRADDIWRALKEQQRAREEAEEEEAFKALQAAKAERRKPPPPPQQPAAATASSSTTRDDDEPDATGWTPLEQRALEAALRQHPASAYASDKNARWKAIAAMVPNHSAKECVQRCRALSTAVKANLPPPLLRLDADNLLSVLEHLGGKDLCTVAMVSKEFEVLAHDDALWYPIADSLPAKWAYSRRDRGSVSPWAYTMRTRDGLYGAWRKLNDHRAGKCPYLLELGRVDRGVFIPQGPLHYRVSYGAICELVQLEAAIQEGLNHKVYKNVAEQLVALSPNPRSVVPADLHMTIREIYKTCYPGFGAGTGSGAYAPGLQAGGSSTKASTSGTMLGKGVATMTKKVQDDDMRTRLETKHEFLLLIRH